MKKGRYFLENIGMSVAFSVFVGAMLVAYMMIFQIVVAFDQGASIFQQFFVLLPMMVMIGGVLYMLLSSYGFYYAELPATLAMGETRRNLFFLEHGRLILTSLATGILAGLTLIPMNGFQWMRILSVAGILFLVLLVGGCIGNVLGCLCFRFGKWGLIGFFLICILIGGTFGLLVASSRKGELDSILTGFLTGTGILPILGVTALLALVLSAAVTWPIMKKIEVRF